MKVLVACEFSGRVRKAFAARGHNAWSCDLLDTEEPGQHIIGDAVEVMYGQHWELIIAHPPCTYLANSGVRWLYGGKGQVIDNARWQLMEAACEFFRLCLNAPAAKVCVENPIQHGHAKKLIGAEPTQTIQPWHHGHGEIKATCLWLKGLKPLEKSKVVEGRRASCHLASPGPNRWKERSRTLEGVAHAMAAQWG